MLNINILNNLIKGITEQIPLVHSFYTQSPYESWNSAEVEYGSVSFVVTKVNTSNSTDSYEAVLYYADRLTEDGRNRDYIHSDATAVIHTIVGALNSSNTEYFEVKYPVSITLFEQSFNDTLAGGYANIRIITEGRSECFVDELSVPEIIATSAYYTKEEIIDLFPLRTQLATVAFTGDYNDLNGVPDLVTRREHDSLVEGVRNATSELTEQIANRVSTKFFEGELDALKTQIEGKVDTSNYEITVNRIDNEISSLGNAIDGKVDDNYFSTVKDDIYTELSERATTQQINNVINDIDTVAVVVDSKADKTDLEKFITAQNEINTNLAVEIKNNVGIGYFHDKLKGINNTITANKDAFTDYTTAQNEINEKLAVEINSKVGVAYLETVIDDFDDKLETKTDKIIFDAVVDDLQQQINNQSVVIDSKLDDTYFDEWKNNIEAEVDNKVTRQSFDQFVEGQNAINTQLAVEINNKLGTAYFEGWREEIEAEVDNKVTRQSFDQFGENVYTKTETETIVYDKIEKTLTNYVNSEDFDDKITDHITTELDMDAIVKEVTAEVDSKIDDLVKESVETEIGEYVTKDDLSTEVANQLSGYIKDTDLEQYLTETEAAGLYYNKTEIDSKIGDIDTIINNVLYTL